MIRYNWEAIKKHTKLDADKILDYFYNIYINNSNMPKFLKKNEYARKIVNDSKDLKMQFILNLEGFLENSFNATKHEMLVYLDLVSMRDYFTYINTKKGVNYVQQWKVVDKYDIKKLETNRLLFITDDKIYFVYEGDY